MRGSKCKKNEGHDDQGLDIHTFLWRLLEQFRWLLITTLTTPPYKWGEISDRARKPNNELSPNMHMLCMWTHLQEWCGYRMVHKTEWGSVGRRQGSTSQRRQGNFWIYSSGEIVRQTFTHSVCNELQLLQLIVALLQSWRGTKVATLKGHFRIFYKFAQRLFSTDGAEL